jgi:hypothetical protein
MLAPNETELRGQWIFSDGKMLEDETCKRVRALIEHELRLVSTAPDGWTKIYQDRRDGRLWELTFPHGAMQGGGPPALLLKS